MSIVSIHKSFTDAIAQVPPQVQKSAWDMIHQLTEHPEAHGLNFERVKGAIDPKVHSVRVNQKYRAILVKPEKEDVNLFVWIGNHDQAYAWAEKKRFEVNKATGLLQMWTSPGRNGSNAVKGIFCDYTEKQLIAIGVPEELIPVIYSIQTTDELYNYADEIPEDTFEPLLWIAQGEPYQDVLQIITEIKAEQRKELGKSDQPFLQAMLNTSGQVAVISSDTQLQEMLKYPFDRWRLFLHSTQKELVEKDFSGSVKVLGGAGTGKTVVALHRARKLVRDFLLPDEKLLFTTFNVNMAAIVQDYLNTMCTPEELQRMDVINIDRLAKEIVETYCGVQINKMIESNQDREVIWRQVGSCLNIDTNQLLFIKREYDRFIQPYGIEVKEEYLNLLRKGGKTKIGKKEREEIWKVVEYVRSEMEARGWYEYPDIIRIARRWLESNPGRLSYRAAIVDEAQDFTEGAFKLLRALVPKNRNDLFIVGDPHQRIYSRFAVLSRCGIDVRGQRSRRLRINYRTTEQIRKQAMKVIRHIPFDDLDGGQNFADDISLMSGTEPICVNFTNVNLERQFILKQVKELLSEGILPHEIGLFARTKKMVEKYQKFLEDNGVAASLLTTESHLSNKGVHCGTMHRSKGLEFRVVFLAGVNEKVVPLSTFTKIEDVEEREEYMRKERSLLYVASTRAREKLFITSYGKLSPFLRN
ncbi:UvrD-helicase domain-containing protein [Thermoactinomyces sp. CICC 10522]|uniref:UvrD-helicase domain-containing protein n=1 Tax=Thermoactinomyces sp. CICC 10522 TaxID=2767427 RepID=UPI0018DEA295|nr:UvrD-helicase domain-containing protein [Thermoactinomyces sp. CICC 10522]MBH8605833.1 ATP-dependent helicase [Thermoactinomyces sp. CICC 10522]